jgi:hypothetical protein
MRLRSGRSAESKRSIFRINFRRPETPFVVVLCWSSAFWYLPYSLAIRPIRLCTDLEVLVRQISCVPVHNFFQVFNPRELRASAGAGDVNQRVHDLGMLGVLGEGVMECSVCIVISTVASAGTELRPSWATSIPSPTITPGPSAAEGATALLVTTLNHFKLVSQFISTPSLLIPMTPL